MAGERKIWDAFFKQTGVVHAHSIEEWVDTIAAFCTLPPPTGNGVFLIGGGGGNSVVFSDICIQEGLDVPRLSDSTMEILRLNSLPLEVMKIHINRGTELTGKLWKLIEHSIPQVQFMTTIGK